LSQLSRMRDLSCDLWRQDEKLRDLNMIFFKLKMKHAAKYEDCKEYV